MKTTTIKKIVTIILKHHPNARDDDRRLYQFYLVFKARKHMTGGKNMININAIMDCPNMDTLGRIRRQIQNVDKLYPPSESAKQTRKENNKKLYKELQNEWKADK